MEIKTEKPQLIELSSGQVLVILREEGGRRELHIRLTAISANLIYWEIEDPELPNPSIFKFVLEFINSMKANIEKIVICSLDENGKYLSYVVINDSDRIYKIGLHAPHAIALAVAVKCPIFVTEEVFNKHEEAKKNHQGVFSEEQMKQIFDGMDPKKLIKH